jgi:hypothetical protein
MCIAHNWHAHSHGAERYCGRGWRIDDVPEREVNLKVNLSTCFNWAPHHEGIFGSGVIAPHILDFGTRWRWVVSFTPRLWYPLDRRLGGPQSRSGRGGEEKNSQNLPGLEPPIIQPVVPQRYTTELKRSRTVKYKNKYFENKVICTLIQFISSILHRLFEFSNSTRHYKRVESYNLISSARISKFIFVILYTSLVFVLIYWRQLWCWHNWRTVQISHCTDIQYFSFEWNLYFV